MAIFDDIHAARGRLFMTVHQAVNNAAFSLDERSLLNEFLADPLAADHLLLAQAIVEASPEAAVQDVINVLTEASDALDDVLAGNNNRVARREAIDAVDIACDALSALIAP